MAESTETPQANRLSRAQADKLNEVIDAVLSLAHDPMPLAEQVRLIEHSSEQLLALGLDLMTSEPQGVRS